MGAADCAPLKRAIGQYINLYVSVMPGKITPNNADYFFSSNYYR